MDGVAISIIERPRPLPGHDTPNPTQHPYTLKCEEPENFLMVIHSAQPQAARTTQNNPLKTNGPKNPDPSNLIIGQDGASASIEPG